MNLVNIDTFILHYNNTRKLGVDFVVKNKTILLNIDNIETIEKLEDTCEYSLFEITLSSGNKIITDQAGHRKIIV